MKTNTKQFSARVERAILDRFTLEELKNNFAGVKAIRKDTDEQAARALVDGGCFDCYQSQVAETMAGWFDETPAEVVEYYRGNFPKMWNIYAGLMTREIVRLVK